jgi:hypothetical protein
MDTAQALAPAETDDPNAQIQQAADAFKAFTTGEPVEQPRNDRGQFAPVEELAEEEEEARELAETEPEADEDEQEAAEPAQPMPPSWPADKADEWAQLPAETQGFLAEREAERERAVNAKFQESANARKAADAERAEAKAAREQLSSTLDVMLAAINPVEPDPRAYGAGTGHYNREAYDLAVVEWREQSGVFAQLKAQRDSIASEEAAEESKAFETWKAGVEAEFAPKLVADIPELVDPVKAEPLVRELVTYGIANGIPAELFAEERQHEITSPQLHLLWKAHQFDKLRASPPQAKPKAAGPAVRPGVVSPRSAHKAAQRAKISERLVREGSVDAGAAMWKTVLKG